jgi:Tol biopolymer transport system component
MPDRKHLVFASDRDGSSLLWTIDAFSGDTPRLLPSDSAHVLEPASGPSSDWMVYVDSAENWALRRYEVTSSGLRKDSWILPTNARNHEPVYSPDGKHIAFASDRSGHWAVWMANSDGTDLTQLTSFEGHWMGAISWSPDGTRLVFDARPNGNSNVFMVQLSDRKLVHLIDSPYEDRVPHWSKDGRNIYFSSTRNGSLALYRFNAETREVSPLFPNIFSASESLDQNLIFGGDNVGNFNVFAPNWVPIPAISQHIKPDPVLNWSVSLSGLYFTTRETAESPYEIVRYAHGTFSRLGKIDGAVVPGSDITASPDGRYIVVAEAISTNSNMKIRRLF